MKVMVMISSLVISIRFRLCGLKNVVMVIGFLLVMLR